MTEPTIEVPVSLIEQVRRIVVNYGYDRPFTVNGNCLDIQDLNAFADHVADEVRALLSQPTPSAEPMSADEFSARWRGADTALRRMSEPATPPRIEDMAPGTFLVASVSSTYGLTVKRNANGTTYLESASGRYFNLPDIDPSTIRNVTPPA